MSSDSLSSEETPYSERLDILVLLPTEIAEQILGLLKASELGLACKVSKEWRRLANRDILWKRHCTRRRYPLESAGSAPPVKIQGPLNEQCDWAFTMLVNRELVANWKDGNYQTATLDSDYLYVTLVGDGSQLLEMTRTGDMRLYETAPNRCPCGLPTLVQELKGRRPMLLVAKQRDTVVMETSRSVVRLKLDERTRRLSIDQEIFPRTVFKNQSGPRYHLVEADDPKAFRTSSRIKSALATGHLLCLLLVGDPKALHLWSFAQRKAVRVPLRKAVEPALVAAVRNKIFVVVHRNVRIYDVNGRLKKRLDFKSSFPEALTSLVRPKSLMVNGRVALLQSTDLDAETHCGNERMMFLCWRYGGRQASRIPVSDILLEASFATLHPGLPLLLYAERGHGWDVILTAYHLVENRVLWTMRAGGGRPGGDLFIESIASGSGGRLLTCVLGPGYDPYGRLTQLSVMLSPGRLDSSRRTLCQCWCPVDLSPRAIVLASFDPFRRPLTTLVISYAGLRPQTRWPIQKSATW